VSNFEMNIFGPNFQARVFPEGKYFEEKNFCFGIKRIYF
jgi:hypothetical protein